MKIIQEMNFADFEPWSGACATYNRICDENKESEMENYLEEIFPDGCTDTELNDLLRFDSESIYEALGISEEEDEIEEITLSELGKEYRVITRNLDFSYGSIVIALEDEDNSPYCVLKEVYNRIDSLYIGDYKDEKYYFIDMEDLEEV